MSLSKIAARNTQSAFLFMGMNINFGVCGRKMDWHLYGVDDPETVEPIALLGGDKFGRDLLGRFLYDSRISLTIWSCWCCLKPLHRITLGWFVRTLRRCS